MKDWKSRLKASLTNEEVIKYLRFIAIPVVAVLLIAVIVIVDKPDDGREASAEKAKAAIETVGESESSSSLAGVDLSSLKLEKDAVPELNTLLEAYLQARKDCDVAALNQTFGNSYTDEELAGKQQSLNDEARYYEDFQNISCYTKPGLNPGEYVVYGNFDIKFRQAETVAPTIIVCYAKKGTDGGYYFEQKSTGKTAEYIARMNQGKDVQMLATQVNSSLRSALESDQDLLGVYDTLMKAKSQSTEPGNGESQDADTQNGESQSAETQGEESQVTEAQGGEN